MKQQPTKAPLTSPSAGKDRLYARASATALAVGAGVGLAINDAEATVMQTVRNVTIQNGSYDLDVDGDTVTDFTLSHASYGYDGISYYVSLVSSAGDNRIAVDTYGYGEEGLFAARLSSGQVVDGDLNLDVVPYGKLVASSYTYYGSTYPFYGNWAEGGTGFLALEFDIAGDSHFGWAFIDVSESDSSIQLLKTGYETEVITPLNTIPEPGSLVLLATGAAGLSALRRRRRKRVDEEVEKAKSEQV